MSRNIPCGACKYMRVKCRLDCPLARYFAHVHGFEHFSYIHDVYGAKNFSKLLFKVDEKDRQLTAITLAYEALARINHPIWGTTTKIMHLEQQCAQLQAEVAHLRQAVSQNTPNAPTITDPNVMLGEGSYSQPRYHNWEDVNLMSNPNNTLNGGSSSQNQDQTWECENAIAAPNEVLGGELFQQPQYQQGVQHENILMAHLNEMVGENFAVNPQGQQKVQYEEVGKVSNPNWEIGESSSRNPPEPQWAQYEENNMVPNENTMLDNQEQWINPVELENFVNIEKEEWFENLIEPEDVEILEGFFPQNLPEQQCVQCEEESMIPQQDPTNWVNSIELENFVNRVEEEESEDPVYLDFSELLTDSGQGDLPEW